MLTNRTASLTRNWSALRRGALLLLAAGACSSSEQERPDSATTNQVATKTRAFPGDSLTDSLSRLCWIKGQRGSVLVARADPKVEEGGVAFDRLRDRAGPSVVLCRGVLYADVNALTKLMGDSSKISEMDGVAVVDGTPTRIPAYQHDGVLYVAVAPFARNRRAVLLPSPEHERDATVWPRQALLHLKRSGLTRGRAYQTALREGILP